jgi:YvrJ protein family
MENVPIEMWVTAISNVGFPVVLTLYLLVRFEKRIDSLTEAINTLKNVVDKK